MVDYGSVLNTGTRLRWCERWVCQPKEVSSAESRLMERQASGWVRVSCWIT